MRQCVLRIEKAPASESGRYTVLLESIQLVVFVARRSRATTESSRWSSRVFSILLWLMPWRDCTKIMTAGMPERETSAASWSGPEGMRCALPDEAPDELSGEVPEEAPDEVSEASRMAWSHRSTSCGLKVTGSMFQMRDHSTVQFSSAAKRWLASIAS